jgi:hypothetical protein
MKEHGSTQVFIYMILSDILWRDKYIWMFYRRDESGTDIIRPTERVVRHSNGNTVFEFGHLISVTIRTTLVSGKSMLNFCDPNMMNITIRKKI